jgi:hypothetical protein
MGQVREQRFVFLTAELVADVGPRVGHDHAPRIAFQGGIDVGQRVADRDVDALVEEQLEEHAQKGRIIFQEQNVRV